MRDGRPMKNRITHECTVLNRHVDFACGARDEVHSKWGLHALAGLAITCAGCAPTRRTRRRRCRHPRGSERTSSRAGPMPPTTSARSPRRRGSITSRSGSRAIPIASASRRSRRAAARRLAELSSVAHARADRRAVRCDRRRARRGHRLAARSRLHGEPRQHVTAVHRDRGHHRCRVRGVRRAVSPLPRRRA